MFVGIYLPLTCDFERFLVFMERILNYVNKNMPELVIGGDFNVNLLDNNSRQAHLTCVVTESGFDIVRASETRITMSSATLIEFFLTAPRR